MQEQNCYKIITKTPFSEDKMHVLPGQCIESFTHIEEKQRFSQRSKTGSIDELYYMMHIVPVCLQGTLGPCVCQLSIWEVFIAFCVLTRP